MSFIRDTEWYKNTTKGFIDTSPPKPTTPVKKMPPLQDFLIRTNKMIDIGFITKFQTEFSNKEEDKKSVIRISLSLILLIWINGVLIYFARNFVELIPYPFDNLFGFHHNKVKELSGATAFTFVLLYYQPNLNKMMKYLTVRWKNTFEGRSFIDGLRMLGKPAIKPTVTEDGESEKKNKKSDQQPQSQQPLYETQQDINRNGNMNMNMNIRR
jgi:hypothetical protein